MPPAFEIICPSCSGLVARVRRARLTIGRPFEECPKCRTLVNRPATHEWDLLGAGRKAYWVADRLARYLAYGLVPALAYWAVFFRDGAGDKRILLGLLGAGVVLVVLFPLSASLNAIRRSRSRMSDPMYRARLIEFMRHAPSVERS